VSKGIDRRRFMQLAGLSGAVALAGCRESGSGGVGTLEGPIIGTIVFFVLQETLSGYGAWYLVLLGAVAVLVTLLARRGLWGLVADRTGWSLFPVQRRLQELHPTEGR
jgi:hypothetical protein